MSDADPNPPTPGMPTSPPGEGAPPPTELLPPRSGELPTVRLDPAGPVTGVADHGRHAVPGYELLHELGRGGMGVVYLARQQGLNRLVALKMILGGAHAGADNLIRFRREAEAAGRLGHPNIVQVYEVGSYNGLPFLSLEYCNGGNLAARLGGKPLPGREAAALQAPVARAVHVAHQAGIVHRDLKPGNILLQRSEIRGPRLEGAAPDSRLASSDLCPLTSDLYPKITDFGLAKHLRPGDATVGLTRTGEVMGTPSYMAPEQAGDTRNVGPSCDVYGLGAILYELLTGRPPFLAPTHVQTVLQVQQQEPLPPRMLNRAIDADLERVALKCLEKQPERRYASALELAEDLDRYLHGEPVRARTVNLLERLQRELAHSQHDVQLRPWGKGLMILGGLILIAQLLTSVLLVEGCPRLPAFWAPRAVLLVLLVPLFLKYRPTRAVWPTNAVERLLWAVWVGYLLTFASLFWVMQVLRHDHLQIYGVVTAVSGLAWFTMGGHVWGGCYLIGGAFLLLAPLIALRAGDPWSPFYFGALWCAALLVLGHRYWKLGRGPR
jgi:serine/threonine protein kinase